MAGAERAVGETGQSSEKQAEAKARQVSQAQGRSRSERCGKPLEVSKTGQEMVAIVQARDEGGLPQVGGTGCGEK